MAGVDDLILISVDDHLIEPPDLFVNHLPAKHLDRAPKLERNAEGSDVWVFNGIAMETVALNAVAGRPKEEYGMEPQNPAMSDGKHTDAPMPARSMSATRAWMSQHPRRISSKSAGAIDHSSLGRPTTALSPMFG